VAVWFQQVQTDLGRARADHRTVGAFWRRAEAAKRDIPSHTFPFPCHSCPGWVRIAYASHYPYILGSHGKASFLRCTSHVRSNFSIIGVEYKGIHGLDGVAGTKIVPPQEHVMKRRSHGAQE
jgi:hypothetical protein